MLGHALLGALLTFTFHDMPFDDGGTLSGSFTWDSTADTIPTWDLITAGGTFPDLEYTTANSWKTLGTHLYLHLGQDRRRITLSFNHGQSGPGLYSGDNAINTNDTQEWMGRNGYSDYRTAALQVFGFAFDSVKDAQAEAARLTVPECSILMWLPMMILAAWRFSAWSRAA